MADKKNEMTPDEEMIYREILAKEMKEKLKNKIESNDPNVIKTIKIMLEDNKKKK